MIFHDLMDMAGKEKKKKEKAKTAKNVQKVAIGMGIVAAAGVVAGILTAPKSGKETRDDLAKKAVDTVENIKGSVTKKAENVKDTVAHAAQEVCKAIKDVHDEEIAMESSI